MTTEAHYVFQQFFFPIAPSVIFEQSVYVVNETKEVIQAVLGLTNPSSVDISVQVFASDGSAIGMQYVTASLDKHY